MPPIKRPKRALSKTFIREWREYRGLEPSDLAARLGIDQSTLNRLENSKTPYNQYHLEMLGDILACSPADLISVNPTTSLEISRIIRALTAATPVLRDAAINALKGMLNLNGN